MAPAPGRRGTLRNPRAHEVPARARTRDPRPDLRKTFRVPVREAGLAAAVRSLFRREHREVRAVDGVSFAIEPGEVVGFLGPNGAGKTTTLKMLSGLLYPTGGEATVLGHVPSRREADFLRRITMVMGNRNQLQWDLPGARLVRADPGDLPARARRLPGRPATSSSSCSTCASSSPSRSATCRSASG